MATLQKGSQTVTVPDETEADYRSDGWTPVGEPVDAPAPKKKASTRKRATSAETKKAAENSTTARSRRTSSSTTASTTSARGGATRGVSARSVGGSTASTADSGSV